MIGSALAGRRAVGLAIASLAIPSLALAQISGQSFEVIPEAAHATVGDTVTLRFRVRLDERDLLFDTVPRPLSPPPGVRLLSVEKLIRAPDRIFNGRARLAFYRPGRQPIPIFALPFMRAVKGVQHATLSSDSAFIEIASLLPAGNPSLKDIRELEPGPSPGLLPLAVSAALAAALLVAYLRRRRRRQPAVVPPETDPVPPSPAPSPYGIALEALNQLERAGWPAKGRVDRHYEAAVEVIRNYLEAAEHVDARERTTEELVWALPPHLSELGLRNQLRELLDEADLVKFARLRPNPAAAALFLQRCRALLSGWHGVALPSEAADALR
jgi:hypothetical protein